LKTNSVDSVCLILPQVVTSRIKSTNYLSRVAINRLTVLYMEVHRINTRKNRTAV